MDQERVMPGSGVCVPLVGPATKGWFHPDVPKTAQ
jgi:hypothetical protein